MTNKVCAYGNVGVVYDIVSIETAVNIGYSCKLLTENMKLFIVDKEDREGVREQLQEALDEILRVKGMVERGEVPHRDSDPTVAPPGPPFGIILNGHSLVREGLM